MGKAVKIQQILVGASGVASGDFTLDLKGKVVGVRVTNLITAGPNVLVGWNASAQNKDVLVPGQGKPYGIDGYYLAGTMYINFDDSVGAKQALVEIWTEQPEDVC